MLKRFSLFFMYTFLFASLFAQTTSSAEEIYNEGKKLSTEGKYKEAIEKYKTALVKKPDYADALYETG